MQRSSELKISVIIPVYNVEKYLERCLLSIINQTLREIEIICVNNGSEDSSALILEKYAQSDSRIKIYNCEKGVSRARNIGLDAASGEYIHFMDSDDYISKTFYEELYSKAKKENLDLVYSSSYKIYENDVKRVEKYHFTNENLPPEAWTTSTVWFFIYRRDLDVHFDETKIYGEDDLFTFWLFRKIKSVGCAETAVYYYCQRENSTTNSYADNNVFFLDRSDIINQVGRNFLENKICTDAYYRTIKMEIGALAFCTVNIKYLYEYIKVILKAQKYFAGTVYYSGFYKLIFAPLKGLRKKYISIKLSSKRIYVSLMNKCLINWEKKHDEYRVGI